MNLVPYTSLQVSNDIYMASIKRLNRPLYSDYLCYREKKDSIDGYVLVSAENYQEKDIPCFLHQEMINFIPNKIRVPEGMDYNNYWLDFSIHSTGFLNSSLRFFKYSYKNKNGVDHEFFKSLGSPSNIADALAQCVIFLFKQDTWTLKDGYIEDYEYFWASWLYRHGIEVKK